MIDSQPQRYNDEQVENALAIEIARLTHRAIVAEVEVQRLQAQLNEARSTTPGEAPDDQPTG